MANKRGNEPAPEPDLDLMEHLVRKSLDVNPALRGGKSTHQVLAALREEALARSKSTGSEASSAAAVSPSERCRGTIAYFLDEKVKDLEKHEGTLRKREEKLRADRERLHRRVTDEIIDFIALVGEDQGTVEAKAVLTEYRTFLLRLGTDPRAILSFSSRARR